jgi:hypothetical protein
MTASRVPDYVPSFLSPNPMTYLRERQLCAHVTDAVDVLFCLARLQQLRRLNDGLECLGNSHVRHVVVTRPLLEVTDVVTDLHALRPVAQVLAQQQVVERVRADKVEQLRNKSKSTLTKFTQSQIVSQFL